MTNDDKKQGPFLVNALSFNLLAWFICFPMGHCDAAPAAMKNFEGVKGPDFNS